MNLIVYFFTFQIVYLCYSVALFGPILFLLFYPNAPDFLAILGGTIIVYMGIPLLVLLFWLSHQTTKRIAFWHLSFLESFKDTFNTLKSYLNTLKSYIGLIFPSNYKDETKKDETKD